MNVSFFRSHRQLVSLALSVAVVSSAAFADSGEDAKLKALQRAMSAPGVQADADEFSPKAIVFDKEPEAGGTQNAKPVTAQGGATDCASLPANVQTTAVDFEIQFKVGSADLSPVSEGTLYKIAKILSLAPDRCVFVEGHTDVSGNPDVNLRLSRERANSVVKFVVEKGGLQLNRLVPQGKGSSEPLKNLDPRNPKNRRVVFKVVG